MADSKKVAQEAIKDALRALRKRQKLEEGAHAPAVNAISKLMLPDLLKSIESDLHRCNKARWQLSKLVDEIDKASTTKTAAQEKEDCVVNQQDKLAQDSQQLVVNAMEDGSFENPVHAIGHRVCYDGIIVKGCENEKLWKEDRLEMIQGMILKKKDNLVKEALRGFLEDSLQLLEEIDLLNATTSTSMSSLGFSWLNKNKNVDKFILQLKERNSKMGIELSDAKESFCIDTLRNKWITMQTHVEAIFSTFRDFAFDIVEDRDDNPVLALLKCYQFLDYSQKKFAALNTLLDENVVNFPKLGELIKVLREQSDSIGACKISTDCQAFNFYVLKKDKDGCKKCLQVLVKEREQLQMRIRGLLC